MLSIFAHDAIALPLAPTFPNSELQYILKNSSATLFLATSKFKEQAQEVLKGAELPVPQLSIIEKIESGAESAENVKFDPETGHEGGFMLYTSGTTNRPKGVVLSQSNITAQARSLIKAWDYSPDDYLFHVLPLHHIHGTINALITPLMAGCTIEFLFPFNAETVWKRFAAPFMSSAEGLSKRAITFFTVVPTIYTRLLSTHNQLDEKTQSAAKTAISPQNLRLNISGSAALPTPVKAAWTELSEGNVLLERFGMTEVGMALSCGLEFSDRVDGSVGWPLPGVEARLVELDTGEVIRPGSENDELGNPRQGEIQLRGPTIFSEYWQNTEATAKEFVDAGDGRAKWFKTGDVAYLKSIQGAGTGAQDWTTGPMFFITGRSSVDIIKTGGEKVSALEVERELLSLPQVAEAAVLGLDSEQWGQKVVAIVVLTALGQTGGRGNKSWGVMDMRRALKDKLVNYKIPQELKVVEEIPRNAMGKGKIFMTVHEFWLTPSSQ